MADGSAPDLRSQWRDLITQWERSFDAIANQLMGTEGFSQLMNQGQQATLAMQKLVADTVGRQLMAVNMPTREDIQNLAETLLRMEQRLEAIETRLADVEPAATGSQAAQQQPARSKQPPEEFLEREAAQSPSPAASTREAA